MLTGFRDFAASPGPGTVGRRPADMNADSATSSVDTAVGEARRLVIGSFVLVVVICLLANALPDTPVTRPLGRPVASLFGVTGLDQGWRLFAPNPRREQIDLSARVEFSDGSATVWRVPRGRDALGGLRDYRWRKWLEHVVVTPDAALSRRTGRYLARTLASDARRPVRVIVTRRWAAMPAFGTTTRLRWITRQTLVALEARP